MGTYRIKTCCQGFNNTLVTLAGAIFKNDENEMILKSMNFKNSDLSYIFMREGIYSLEQILQQFKHNDQYKIMMSRRKLSIWNVPASVGLVVGMVGIIAWLFIFVYVQSDSNP